MRWIGRLFLVAFALILAVSASTLFLFFAALLDPVMAIFTGESLWVGLSSLIDAIVSVEDPDVVMEGALSGMGRLAFSILLAPPLFVALAGEIMGLRRLVWHAGATGLLTAALPWLWRDPARAATPEEIHISLVLGLTGAVAGFVYWAVAGHGAGASRTSAERRG